MEKQRKARPAHFADALSLPKDIIYGAVLVTAKGQTEILIENYKGIIEYTSEKIKIQTKTCKLSVCGKNLLIEYYTNEEMKIVGIIGEIIYDERS
ncbi:sporulation protein YqfC [Clostridia bacterium]|nr:sporulation protein YqfC [Clostridia bacterium]